MPLDTDAPSSDFLVTGNIVVDVFEVQELKPIRGWVAIEPAISSRQGSMSRASSVSSIGAGKVPDHPPGRSSFVPSSAFDSAEVLGEHILGTLDEVSLLVERQLGLRRPGCHCKWEPWASAPTTTQKSTSAPPHSSMPRTDISGNTSPAETCGEVHLESAVSVEAPWEYAFNAKHEFEQLPDGVLPPSASHTAADGALASQHQRLFIRRRRYRQCGSLAWDSQRIVPEGIRNLCCWCTSVKIHKAPSDSQTNSPTTEVPKLTFGLGRGLSRPGSTVGDVPLSARRTRSRGSSVASSHQRHGLIPTDHWMKDADARNCGNCSKVFGVITRRHHCRLCGRVFCSQCCGKNESYGGVRVCVPCITEDEECDRQAEEERLEEEERLRDVERDLLFDSPENDGLAHPTTGQSGDGPPQRPAAAPPRTNMSLLLFQLEADCRGEIAQQKDEEFRFLSSLGAKELSALQDLCDLHTLPSLVQLSESLNVMKLDRTMRPSEEPVREQNTNGGGSGTSACVMTPSAPRSEPVTPPSHGDPTIAPRSSSQQQSSSSLTGMLNIKIHKIDGIKLSKGVPIRCDMQLGDSNVIKGNWVKLDEEPLVGYVLVDDEHVSIHISAHTRGGNALTDLVLDVTHTVAQIQITLADLMTAEQLTGARAAKEPTQYKGSYPCLSVFGGSSHKKPLKDGKAVICWTFDVRPAMSSMDFCGECGRVPAKCCCHLPLEIVEPVFLGAPDKVDGTDGATSNSSHAPSPPSKASSSVNPARSEIVVAERVQATEAWEKLVTCAADRMLLEKRYSISNIDQEQREDYGKLRGEYFRATTAMFYRLERRKRFPEIEQHLEAISSEALRKTACVYLSMWHQHAIIHGPERRLKRARCRLEERVGLLNAPPPKISDAVPPPVAAKPKRKPTSEKCCALM